jgi:hypothetical protein
MHGKVKQLHQRGVRIPNREISQAPFIEGDLTLAALRSTYILEVKDTASKVGASLFPALYKARLTTMHGSAMLFKGEERPDGDGGPAYVQEWSVMIEPR